MLRVYRIFRDVISWMFLAAVAGLVGEFAVDLAKEFGYFEHPTKTLEAIMSLLSLIHNQFWFWPAVAGLGGLVSGMWLDTFVLRHVRTRNQLEEKPKSDLVFMFDETNERFARFSTEKLKRQYFVGIHNCGLKTVLWVSVRVSEAGRSRVFNETQIPGSPQEKESILFECGALDPNATECFEIMVGPAEDSSIGRMAFYNRSHRFFLEARARDVLTVRAEFEYQQSGKIKMLST